MQALEEELDDLVNEGTAAARARESGVFDAMVAPFTELVLFGAGNLGRRVLLGLRTKGIEPLAITDNNSQLWGSSIEGVPVLSPQEAADRYSGRAAFVSAIWSPGNRFVDVRAQLRGLGCGTVVPFMPLFWRHPGLFLPHYCIDLPHKILEQAEMVRACFRILGDDQSRREYLSELRWRLRADFEDLISHDYRDSYFSEDLLTLSLDECFVDCGAFDGDTLQAFLGRRGASFLRIVALEPDPANFERLRAFVSGLDAGTREKIALARLAVGRRRETLLFEASGTASSAIAMSGGISVDCAPLDEILADETPTFLKMDIEGAEPEALEGARRIIERRLPALAIRIYHVQDHLWRIPLQMNAMSSAYKLYVRRYDDEGSQTVCYAVPPGRLPIP